MRRPRRCALRPWFALFSLSEVILPCSRWCTVKAARYTCSEAPGGLPRRPRPCTCRPRSPQSLVHLPSNAKQAHSKVRLAGPSMRRPHWCAACNSPPTVRCQREDFNDEPLVKRKDDIAVARKARCFWRRAPSSCSIVHTFEPLPPLPHFPVFLYCAYPSNACCLLPVLPDAPGFAGPSCLQPALSCGVITTLAHPCLQKYLVLGCSSGGVYDSVASILLFL